MISKSTIALSVVSLWLAGASFAQQVCLPAPHPAVRALLAAGWHNDDLDLYMATEPDLLDPRRAVPSPALA